MNIFIASGNLGQDYELKYTPNGKAIGEFSLPVKQGWGDHEKLTWVNCKVLGDRAAKLDFLKKGMKVMVSGEIVLETWEGAKGKGSKLVCIVRDIDLPNKSSDKVRPQAIPVATTPPVDDGFADTDIPFVDQYKFSWRVI